MTAHHGGPGTGREWVFVDVPQDGNGGALQFPSAGLKAGRGVRAKLTIVCAT